MKLQPAAVQPSLKVKQNNTYHLRSNITLGFISLKWKVMLSKKTKPPESHCAETTNSPAPNSLWYRILFIAQLTNGTEPCPGAPYLI